MDVKNSVFNLKNAFIGIGVGVGLDFLNTAREVERLKVRLKFLFGSVESGAKAFESFIKICMVELPFSPRNTKRCC